MGISWGSFRVLRNAAVAVGIVATGCGEVSQNDNEESLRTEPTLELVSEVSLPDESAPFAAVVRSDGSVVFVDPTDRIPFLVGQDGRARPLMRVGSGPGETSGLIGVAAGPNGQLALLDGVQRRLHILDGRDSSVFDQRIDVGTPFGLWWPDDASRIWVRGGTTGLNFSTTLYRISIPSGEMTPHATAPIRSLNDADAERAAMCLQCPAALSRDSMIVSFRGDTTYRLHQFAADGSVKAAWASPTHPVARVSQHEVDSATAVRDRIAEQMSKMPGFQAQALTMVAPVPKLGDPKRRFVLFGFAFDGTGALWAQPTSTEGDSATLHWYPRSGAQPKVIQLAPGSRLYHVRDDKLLVGISNDAGVVFRVYAIVEQ
jgi:hypothetical protein